MNQLRRDVAQQRQIISDHLIALRLQSFWNQQTYEDAELARAEGDRLRQLSEQRVQRAMLALQENEGCNHQWVRRRGYLGNCERCDYELNCYGMRCVSDCESTVCYTYANFRIPRRGWR